MRIFYQRNSRLVKVGKFRLAFVALLSLRRCEHISLYEAAPRTRQRDIKLYYIQSTPMKKNIKFIPLVSLALFVVAVSLVFTFTSPESIVEFFGIQKTGSGSKRK